MRDSYLWVTSSPWNCWTSERILWSGTQMEQEGNEEIPFGVLLGLPHLDVMLS